MNEIEDSKFMGKILNRKILKVNFVVFDLETTGLSPSKNEIIEIGALKVKKMNVIDQGFDFLVKPKGEIDPRASKVNGFHEKDLEKSPSIDKILPKFLEFATNSILIAYNAKFDIGFLQSEAKKLGISETFYFMDALLLTKKLINSLSYKLGDIANILQVKVNNSHRAGDDARVTAEIFIKLSRISGTERMKGLHQMSPIKVVRT